MKSKIRKSFIWIIKIVVIAALCTGCAFFLVYYGIEYICSSNGEWYIIRTITPELEQLVMQYISKDDLPPEANIKNVTYDLVGDESHAINVYIEIPNHTEAVDHFMQIINVPPDNIKMKARDYWGEINPNVFHNEIVETNTDTVLIEACREVPGGEIISLGIKIGSDQYTYPPKLPAYPLFLVLGGTVISCIIVVFLPMKKKQREANPLRR